LEDEVKVLENELNCSKKQFEIQQSLRTQVQVQQKAFTPHYIPNRYSGSWGEQVGHPLHLEVLRDVASVVCSGEQCSKYQLQHVLSETDITVPHSTFFCYADIVYQLAEDVFNDSHDTIVNEMKLRTNNVIALDGRWTKRGYTSNHGRFCVINLNSNKIIWVEQKTWEENTYKKMDL